MEKTTTEQKFIGHHLKRIKTPIRPPNDYTDFAGKKDLRPINFITNKKIQNAMDKLITQA